MTTSHRPQLEARSGAKAAAYVPTSTQHASLLPGHKKLKYRKGRDEQESSYESQKDYAFGDEGGESYQNMLVKQQVEMDQERRQAEEDKEEVEDEEEYEGEEEDSDDQEVLLQELNKIRRERMMRKVREEQNQHNSIDLARVPTHRSTSDWRNTTFGRNRVSKQKPSKVKGEGYVNEMTKTAYHEDFMRRFVK